MIVTLKSVFVAEEVLSKIKDARAVRRKRCTWGISKLNKYLTEVIQLSGNGASFADIQFWLRKEKRIKVDRSTIKRFLDKNKLSVDFGR